MVGDLLNEVAARYLECPCSCTVSVCATPDAVQMWTQQVDIPLQPQPLGHPSAHHYLVVRIQTDICNTHCQGCNGSQH